MTMISIGAEFHGILTPVKERLDILAYMAGITVKTLRENLPGFLKTTGKIEEGNTREQGYANQGWLLKAGTRDSKSILQKLCVNDKGLLYIADLIKKHADMFLKQDGD